MSDLDLEMPSTSSGDSLEEAAAVNDVTNGIDSTSLVGWTSF